MPEGDTIHYAANRIRPVLEGTVPDSIRTPQPRHAPQQWPERLAGLAVRAVDARGKHLFLHFEQDLRLHSHLRMTGAWGVYPRGGRWRRSPHRAWLVIAAGQVEVVQFDGPVLELLCESQSSFDKRVARLGEDVLGHAFDQARFLARLRAGDQRRTIGEALLDQRVVAGIGNVWKSEACFAVHVDPARPVGQVRPEDALAIVAFAREQMARSAVAGSRVRPKAVYKRRGMPCPRCGARIRGEGQGDQNRGTFWCPQCQH